MNFCPLMGRVVLGCMKLFVKGISVLFRNAPETCPLTDPRKCFHKPGAYSYRECRMRNCR